MEDELLKQIIDKLGAMDKRFDAIDKRFDAVDHRFDAMDKRFDTLEKKVDHISEQVGRNSEDITQIKEGQKGIIIRQQNQEKVLEGLTVRFFEHDTDIRNLGIAKKG